MELTLTNKAGKPLDLLHGNGRYTLIACDALHGLETDIGDVSSPYLDGTIVESVKALPRGILLTFALIPPIREALDFVSEVVKTKQRVTLTERENGREISISGIATMPPYSRMNGLCKLKVAIYCNQPYWEDINAIVGYLSTILPKLNFPIAGGQYFTRVAGTSGGRVFGVVDTNAEKTFVNDGDVAVGMIIRITALALIQNPRISCSTGDQNGWWMQLNLTLRANDEVEICTERGNKYIRINGSDEYIGEPILSFLEFHGDDWLQMEVGENTFNISPTNDDVVFGVSFKRRYE